MAITKQDVWRVAGEIDRAGDKPTAIEVRKRLGTGSYSTITAALKEWVRPDEDAAELDPMPEEFSEKILQAGADLFALAMRIANEQMQAEREQWASDRAALEAERDEAIAVADELTKQLDVMTEDHVMKVRAHEAEVEKLTGEQINAYAVTREAQARATATEAKYDEARHQASKLEGEVEALKAVIAQFGDGASSARRETVAKKKSKNGDAVAHQVVESVTTEA